MKHYSTTTQQAVNNSVFKRWAKQYQTTKVHITERLKNLKNPTEEEITNIIGNDSWTRIVCGVCEKKVSEVVFVGENIMYEQSSVAICKGCLAGITNALDKVYEE